MILKYDVCSGLLGLSLIFNFYKIGRAKFISTHGRNYHAAHGDRVAAAIIHLLEGRARNPDNPGTPRSGHANTII